MKYVDFLTVSYALLDKHGLSSGGWKIKITDSLTYLGQCSYLDKTLNFSKHHILNNSEEELTVTILHEIAHALVGGFHGHDLVWKTKCLAIGGDGRTKGKPGLGPSIESYPVHGICQGSCGIVAGRQRIGTRMKNGGYKCGKCGSNIEWRKRRG